MLSFFGMDDVFGVSFVGVGVCVGLCDGGDHDLI